MLQVIGKYSVVMSLLFEVWQGIFGGSYRFTLKYNLLNLDQERCAPECRILLN